MSFFAAVLWDLDGTLVDSEELHFRAWRATLAAHGVDYDHAAFRAGFGQSNRSVLRDLFPDRPDVELTRISRDKEATYRALLRADGIQLLSGARAWLEHLQDRGTIQAVSSSGPMANIAATIATVDAGDYFQALFSGAPLPKGKPHPDLFLLSARGLGTAPAQCLVIEDSVHGIEAARRAGMASIAVGSLSASPALPALLHQVDGPPCLPVPSFDHLTRPALANLWRAAQEQ